MKFIIAIIAVNICLSAATNERTTTTETAEPSTTTPTEGTTVGTTERTAAIATKSIPRPTTPHGGSAEPSTTTPSPTEGTTGGTTVRTTVTSTTSTPQTTTPAPIATTIENGSSRGHPAAANVALGCGIVYILSLANFR